VCFTFIAGIIFFTSPLLFAEMRWGTRWREERRVRFEKRDEEKKRVEAEISEAEGKVCRRCEYPGYLDGYLGIVLAKAFRFMIF
jgi:hypothetical protein